MKINREKSFRQLLQGLKERKFLLGVCNGLTPSPWGSRGGCCGEVFGVSAAVFL